MKQRGRKSIAELLVISVDGKPDRLEPPDHLSADERRRFVEIVANCDRGHFRPSDLPLLCRFVEADALAEKAADELRKNAVLKNGKVNAWLAVQEKNVRALVSLAMRLRLSPQSRIDAQTLGRQQPTRASAYDTTLEACMRIAKCDPSRAEQLDGMLQQGNPWIEVAEFASYSCQIDALSLRPWQSPAPRQARPSL